MIWPIIVLAMALVAAIAWNLYIEANFRIDKARLVDRVVHLTKENSRITTIVTSGSLSVDRAVKDERDRHDFSIAKWMQERKELTDALVEARANGKSWHQELLDSRRLAAENADIANERSAIIVDLRAKIVTLMGGA